MTTFQSDVLVVGGGAFAYRTYRQNRPIHAVLLQLQISPDAAPSEQATTLKAVMQKLREPALLTRASKEAGLTKKLQFATDEAAANDLGKRLFAELGEADTPKGRMPVINIGFNCKVKEFNTMTEVSQHLNQTLKKP